MEIKQFEDENLSHYSYAILSHSEKKIVLIDPARNPQPYLHYAAANNARITGIIETHPHADFVSCHLELHHAIKATIYASRKTNATYPHQRFDEGQQIQLGEITLSALNTPGHSPDSICILLKYEGRQKAVFTGDTLFIGDCGRPDLRPGNGDATEQATRLAGQMYHSLRDQLMPLRDEVIIYPTHGAGSLCGKALRKANSSTMGEERNTNWSLQPQPQDEFINELLSGQPFVPAYFPFDAELNKTGTTAFQESIDAVKISEPVTGKLNAGRLERAPWIVDVRKEEAYKQGHLPHSLNLMQEGKFETWLGSIIKPGELFYLAAADRTSLMQTIKRTAAIGYESQVLEAFILDTNDVMQEKIDVMQFREYLHDYTIIDVRNVSEIAEKKIFEKSIAIPLGELRESISAIPLDKPIVVHCAGGYRSAAGSSLLQSELPARVKVFDLGDAVKYFP